MLKLVLSFFIALSSITAISQCFNESFSNIGPYGGYQTETWTGDDGYTLTATDARTDETINGPAITVRDGSLSVANVAGGIGSLTVTTQRAFSGGTGLMDLIVNGTVVGSIPYDGTVQTTTISNIDITGSVTVEIDATNSSSDRVIIDDLTWTCFSSSNSITTSSVSTLTFNVDCSTDDTGTVDFTSVGTFAAGNNFTAQLSDATGSFASPTNIGSVALSGIDPSGTISITIPQATTAGSAYRIRVVSTDPTINGSDNGTDITINAPSCTPTSCMDESFTNIPSSSSTTYLSRTWVGDDGYSFTSTDSRSDQTINGAAILVRNGSLSVNGVTGGIGDLTLTTQRVFSGGTGILDVHVNGASVGSIPYDGTVQTSTISGINITGNVNVEIFTPSNGDRVVMDDLQWTCFASSNTITTSTVSPLTFNVDCSTDDTGTVDFTSVGTFAAGNNFTAELSDASGSFASPTTIGSIVLGGTDPSGTINITIPSGTASGTGYRIRVVSDNPTTVGSDNGADITINLSGGPCFQEPPHMTSLIINSCNTSCGEGDNEVVFGNTGDYSVDMSTSNIEVTYGSNPSPTTTYSNPIVSNSATTSSLNTVTSCPGLFIDAAGTTVPPNSTFMLVNNAFCPNDGLDLANFCGSGPIYVIYTTDGNWNSGGNFVNSSGCSGGVRYLTTTITATDGSTHTIDYEFDCTLNSGTDGDYAKWNYNGGAATEQGNNGCTLDPVVLPVELLFMTVEKDKSNALISWSTASERNNSHFILSHSIDGYNFNTLSSSQGAGTTTNTNYYSDVHFSPKEGINYYKLQSVDFDGTTYLKGVRALEFDFNTTFYDYSENLIHTKTKGNYNVVNLAGQIVKRGRNTAIIPFVGRGVYIVQNLITGESEKLVIH